MQRPYRLFNPLHQAEVKRIGGCEDIQKHQCPGALQAISPTQTRALERGILVRWILYGHRGRAWQLEHRQEVY